MMDKDFIAVKRRVRRANQLAKRLKIHGRLFGIDKNMTVPVRIPSGEIVERDLADVVVEAYFFGIYDLGVATGKIAPVDDDLKIDEGATDGKV